MSFTHEQKEVVVKKALVLETYLSVGQQLSKRDTNDSVFSYGFKARDFGGMSDRLLKLNTLIEGVSAPANYRIAALECLTGIAGDQREGLNLILRNAEDNSLASPFSEIFMELGTGTSFTRDFPYVFRIIPDEENVGSYIMEERDEEMKVQTWLRENLNSTIRVRFRAYAFSSTDCDAGGYSTYTFLAERDDGSDNFGYDVDGGYGSIELVDGPDLAITRLTSYTETEGTLRAVFRFESNLDCAGQTAVEVHCVELDNTWIMMDEDVSDHSANGERDTIMGFAKTEGMATTIRIKRHGCDQCDMTPVVNPG